jgi:predicted Zn-dependent protease
MEEMDAPYYISAVSTDTESFFVSAEFGQLLQQASDRHRTLGTEVRVGTPALDNTNFVDRGELRFSFGEGGPAPVETDVDAVRQELWLEFDRGYKQAAETLAKKRAYLRTNDVSDRPADFAPHTPTVLVLPREKLQVDRSRWTHLAQQASAVFRRHPAAYAGEVDVYATMAHQQLLDTEGTRYRFAEPRFQVTIRARSQAPDGMELTSVSELYSRTEAELPTDQQLTKAAEAVAQKLDELVKAPVLDEDYTGPVLFTGSAAASFFLVTAGDSLSHPRIPLGDPTTGGMTERINKHVAPKFLTLKDDPTQRAWRGQSLLGYYPIDDDGVKPEPITLVDRGVLKTYYMSRIPTKDVATSNGHSRAGQGAAASLFVSGGAGLSRAALKKKLVELAAEEDLSYGLLVDDLSPAQVRGGAEGQLQLPAPMSIYRVYKDGREELIRGASFKPTTYRVLKDVVAVGSSPALLNTVHHGQPVSVVAPAVLVKGLELRRPAKEFEKPPFSERPAL